MLCLIILKGFLVDKFGKYKPVVVLSLLLNALFHHSLLFIPQQEIPGVVPAAYVMRHPQTGYVELWWSPCPSRECPEDEELDVIVDQCIDHCLLLEQNPKIENLLRATKIPPHMTTDLGEIDDLNFHLSKKKHGSTTIHPMTAIHPTVTPRPNRTGSGECVFAP